MATLRDLGLDGRRAARAAPSIDRLARGVHRRFNPLTGDWVLLSTGRTARPWQGAQEAPVLRPVLAHDPGCYLCPGNVRVSGERNPEYSGVYVFPNDFPALRPNSEAVGFRDGPFRAESVHGTCRVVCYSSDHSLSLGELPTSDIEAVVDAWTCQTIELGERYAWVQIFENRGAAMGASNPHPHGQIWAGSALPREGAREDASQRGYLARTGRSLLSDYAERESSGPRVVEENDDWIAVVPFWAVWPFETLILPRDSVPDLASLELDQRLALADLVRRLLSRYDNLFTTPFPYSMGWHQAPFGAASRAHWQLHGHLYPPLLRSATIRKFMVGYELLAEPQRDLSPEDAAMRLRAVTPVRRERPPNT